MYSHLRLMAALIIKGSSLGSYGIDWFTYFHQLCSGKSARELANLPKAKNWAPINIIFPSLATVDSSLMGRRGGGTMFAGKAWNSVMKPRFHDCNSKSGGVLIHAKVGSAACYHFSIQVTTAYITVTSRHIRASRTVARHGAHCKSSGW